jgi:hypothetical protein
MRLYKERYKEHKRNAQPTHAQPTHARTAHTRAHTTRRSGRGLKPNLYSLHLTLLGSARRRATMSGTHSRESRPCRRCAGVRSPSTPVCVELHLYHICLYVVRYLLSPELPIHPFHACRWKGMFVQISPRHGKPCT